MAWSLPTQARAGPTSSQCATRLTPRESTNGSGRTRGLSTGELRSSRPCPRSPTCSNRSEEHTSELQSRENLVCRLLLEKKKNRKSNLYFTYNKMTYQN